MQMTKRFGFGILAALLLFNGAAIYFVAMGQSRGASSIALILCPLGNAILVLLGVLAGWYQRKRDPKFRLSDYVDVLVVIPIVVTIADVIVIFKMDTGGL